MRSACNYARALAVALACAVAAVPTAGRAQPAKGGEPEAPSPCAGRAAVRDRLASLTPEGDLVLETGGSARLSGIRLPDGPPYRDRALAWLRARIGEQLLVESSGARDRWGRMPVRLRPEGADPQEADFARSLVAAGLALVDPGVTEPFCQAPLLKVEDSARTQNLGLWADALYKPVNADQTRRLRERFGTFTLVEGRVGSIGERKQRTYLNFGRHWAEDFTIVIPRRIWKLMAQRGLDAAALKGRRVRARGILEPWQGAALTIVVPEMIERLEDTPPSR